MPYYKRIAQHYESTNNLDEAERYYIKADMAMDAVDMYSRVGKWEAAQKVARGYLTDAEMRDFYRCVRVSGGGVHVDVNAWLHAWGEGGHGGEEVRRWGELVSAIARP